MNLIAFGLILICCQVWANKTDNEFTRISGRRTALKSILENIKIWMKNGDSEHGVPVMDPLIVDELPLKFNEPDMGIKINGFLSNMQIIGLSNFEVNTADFKFLSMKVLLDLSWPLVTMNTDYSISQGNIFGTEIYGQGKLDATTYDFRFQTEITFQLKGQRVQIKQMIMNIALGALDFKVTGLYNDEEKSAELSKMISDMVPMMIDENQSLIVDSVTYIIKQVLDKLLSNVSIGDLMNLG